MRRDDPPVSGPWEGAMDSNLASGYRKYCTVYETFLPGMGRTDKTPLAKQEGSQPASRLTGGIGGAMTSRVPLRTSEVTMVGKTATVQLESEKDEARSWTPRSSGNPVMCSWVDAPGGP